MITENDLLKLRYQVITRVEDKDSSVELMHLDNDERNYLVKLRKGEVYVVYPFTMRLFTQPFFRTDKLEELIAWHNHY
jgi:hypothetical protein